MTFKQFSRLLILHWGDVLQYRADLILWTFVSVITPLISLGIWYKVSQSSSGGPPSQEVLVYYIVLAFTTTATLAWHGFIMVGDILHGGLVKHLIRPISVIWHGIANNIVEKMIRIPALLVMLMIAGLVYPRLFHIIAQESEHPFFFILSLLLATVLSFSLATALSYIAFWLEDANQIIRFRFLFESVASGALIPYAFMPETVRNILSLLPFRYMIAAPIEILLGQTPQQHIVSTLIIQIAWSVAFIIISRILWIRGLKRYAVPGQ